MDEPVAAPEWVIEAYEGLLAHSTRMLASARETDWEALIDQKTRYLEAVARLRCLEGEPLDAGQRQRKAALLERILEQDAEIRRRLVERRDEIGRLLGHDRQRLALSRAYGGTGTVVDAEGRFGRPS